LPGGTTAGSRRDGYCGLTGKVARTWADRPVADISIQAVPRSSGGMILSRAVTMVVSVRGFVP